MGWSAESCRLSPTSGLCTCWFHRVEGKTLSLQVCSSPKSQIPVNVNFSGNRLFANEMQLQNPLLLKEGLGASPTLGSAAAFSGGKLSQKTWADPRHCGAGLVTVVRPLPAPASQE